jgi:hypothetical protein
MSVKKEWDGYGMYAPGPPITSDDIMCFLSSIPSILAVVPRVSWTTTAKKKMETYD